jgi:apolipoprotein N-acyltransferase
VPLAERQTAWTAWLGRLLGPQFGSLSPGPSGQPALSVGDTSEAISICFEVLFDTAIAAKARSAHVLLNTSNFAWFDGPYAARQQLQAGQMRARDTGRWFMQASNTGVTAVAGPDGRLRAQLPPEVRAVLDTQVGLMEGNTPFMVLGNAPVLALCALTVGVALRRRRHNVELIQRTRI